VIAVRDHRNPPREEPVTTKQYNRQTRRARLCINARRPRHGVRVATSRRRVARLTAQGGDLAADAARAADDLELPAEIRKLLSPAYIPAATGVRARQRVWNDMQRLLVGTVREH
jgi:hypothetical protein